jgi:Ca2+-binding EF-hand superfamily protein
VSSNGYIDKEEFKNLIYQIVENQSLDEDIENIFEEFNKENKN